MSVNHSPYLCFVVLSLQLGEVQLRAQLHDQRTNLLHQVSLTTENPLQNHFAPYFTYSPSCTEWLVFAIGKDPSVLVSSPEKPSTTKDQPLSTITTATATPASTTASSTSVGSHDSRTQPHAQVQTGRGREEDAPVINRASHIQPATVPETITPFVTTQHQGQP